MPSLLRLEELSYPQLDCLARKTTIFFLPISPLEEHGPHLPIGVDAFNAAYFAQLAAEGFLAQKRDWTCVLCPLLPVGTNVFRHIGSLRVRTRVVRDLVFDHGASLARYGFRWLVVTSAHGGPRHLVALEEACEKVSRKFGAKMICLTAGMAVDLLTGKFLAEIEQKRGLKFTDQERNWLLHDYHAGWWETSMMLLLRPELVDAAYTQLPPILVKLTRARSRYIPTLGKGLGYFGVPGQASAQFAQLTSQIFREKGVALLLRWIGGENVAAEVHSIFYRLLIFRTAFRRWVAAFLILAAGIGLALYFAAR